MSNTNFLYVFCPLVMQEIFYIIFLNKEDFEKDLSRFTITFVGRG